jgi:hypothetical protein
MLALTDADELVVLAETLPPAVPPAPPLPETTPWLPPPPAPPVTLSELLALPELSVVVT